MVEAVNQSSGASRSYWMSGTRSAEYEPLTKDIRVDVVIIGAGIAGLSSAYALTKQGLMVAVLEDGVIGSGETNRTSAHLSSYADGRLFRFKRLFGIDATRLLVDSHALAIDHIEEIAKNEGIACEFIRVDGYLFSGNNEKRVLENEAKILDEIESLPFEWVEKAPFKNFDTGRCLKFLNQAQFHPMKYLQGLAAAIVKRGGQIFEATHVACIEDGNPCMIRTSEGAQVIANDVIVATNSPINDRLVLQTKQAQYRTYVMGISLPKGEVEEALYWDTEDPYHYVRMVHSPKEDTDYLLIGGEDHRTGRNVSPKQAFSQLNKWAIKRFLKYEIIYQWSGQIIEPIDGLAFIGKNPGNKHIYVHTGSSGSGLTYGVISSLLLPDLILKRKSRFEDLYDPSRKTVKAAGQFLKETCSTIAEYIDWLKPKAANVKKVLPHEGAVCRRGFTLEAVYKDVDGNIHRMSAKCPHLGGVVRWNSLEKTWDCPCHGSRFSANGEVINGPANKGLTKLN